MGLRNPVAMMAGVDDLIAMGARPSARVAETLVKKTGKTGKVERSSSPWKLAGSDLEAWQIELAGAGRSQHHGQRLTLAARNRLTLAVRDELRRPATEDQPETGNHSRLQPGECGQEPFKLRTRAAANAEVRAMNAQRKTEGSGRSVQGIVRESGGETRPRPRPIETDLSAMTRLDRPTKREETTIPQCSRQRGSLWPILRNVAWTACRADNRLIIRVPQQRGPDLGPALRRASRFPAGVAICALGQPAKRMRPDLSGKDNLLLGLVLRQNRTHCTIGSHGEGLMPGQMASPSSSRGTGDRPDLHHPAPSITPEAG